MGIAAVYEFQKQNGQFPQNKPEDANKVLEIAKQINEKNKTTDGITLEEIEEEVIKNVALYC